MKLSIVYDNDVFKKGLGLQSDWGFACLIQTKDENILFDCGAKGAILLENMRILGISLKDIDKVVISHEHWDHNGGLDSLLDSNGDVEIFRCGLSQRYQNTKIIAEAQMISPGIYTTGRLSGMPIDEQSLVLKGQVGWYVLVGCSHPGVEKILAVSKKFGDIVGIIGGLHGFNAFSVLEDLSLICPCHCTKYKDMIGDKYPNKFVLGGVGKFIKI